MFIKAIKTRIYKENEPLLEFILEHIKKLKEKDVLVITSKIVALGEGRTMVVKNKKEKEKIIKQESEFAIKTKWAWLTIKDGIVMASAGIDESNANGKLILLPIDSFKTAYEIQKSLRQHFGLKYLGVIITDSRTEPLRSGVTGKSVGYAGFEGVKSYVGKKDIFKRPFHFSKVSVADSLASGAVFDMGEGNERKPLCVIEGAELKFNNKNVNPLETRIALKDDMYAPLFRKRK
jgi:F420-0:gamma-glutamyl ligase